MSSRLLESNDPLIRSLSHGDRCGEISLFQFRLKGAWPIAGSDDLPQELMQGAGPIGVVVREAWQTNLSIPPGPIFPLPEEERGDQRRNRRAYDRAGGLRAYVDAYRNTGEMFGRSDSQVRYYWHKHNWEGDYTFGSKLYMSEVTAEMVEKPFKYLKDANGRLAFIGGQTLIDREFVALLMQGRNLRSDPNFPPAGVVLLDPGHSSVVLDSTAVSFTATIMSKESGTRDLKKELGKGTNPHIALWKILKSCGNWGRQYATRYPESWNGHEIIVSGDEELTFSSEFDRTRDLVSILNGLGFQARRMDSSDFPLDEDGVLNSAKGPRHLYMRATIAAISTLSRTEFPVNFHPESETIKLDESAKEAWGIVTSGTHGVVVNVARKS